MRALVQNGVGGGGGGGGGGGVYDSRPSSTLCEQLVRSWSIYSSSSSHPTF